MKATIRIISLLTALLLTAMLCACKEPEKSQPADETTEQSGFLRLLKQSTILLEPDAESDQIVDETTLDVVRSILESRLSENDIDDSFVSVDADKMQIKVVLPEMDDSADIRELLTVQGEITIRSPDGEVLMDSSMIDQALPSVMTNYENDDDDAEVISDASYMVILVFSDEGRERFSEITEEYLNQQISICIDDEVLTSPTVNAPITDGSAQIAGDLNAEECLRLATLINCSPLPFPLRIVGSDSADAA